MAFFLEWSWCYIFFEEGGAWRHPYIQIVVAQLVLRRTTLCLR